MIIFDLQCPHGHRFEGWFGSSSDFESQLEANMVSCPTCGATQVGKAPMAPAVPAKSNSRATVASPDGTEMAGGVLPAQLKEALSALAKAQAEALKTSEYVGERFAEESRAIHYGERDGAAIHGKASAEEARDLIEEGISVLPLLTPFAPPEDIN